MQINDQKLDSTFSSQFLSGALAGCISTLPMTVFMLSMHRLLPRWQKYALPPEEITEDLIHIAPGIHRIKKQQLQALSLISHFGYGTGMGTLYALSTDALPLNSTFKGTLFGLLVWSLSYLGWLPALHSSASAYRQPLRRNTLMIAAHIIWGSATGVITKQLLYHL